MRTRALSALTLLVLLVTPVLAMPRSADEPLAFVPVPGVGASVDRRPAHSDGVVPLPSVRLVPVPRPSRPVVDIPEPPVIVVPRSGGNGGMDGGVASRGSGATVRGVASWYCGHGSACTRGYPGGLYAAAGPALRRRSDWRGSYVDVAANGRVVRVRLIDCNCGPNANLIDLYTDVWAALGVPLSRGVLNVTVSW